uniref:Putative secreted protein n=1 Tax=Ixodes ricinus TaxID=34613 RepID=A0A6B0U742_IXORI
MHCGGRETSAALLLFAQGSRGKPLMRSDKHRTGMLRSKVCGDKPISCCTPEFFCPRPKPVIKKHPALPLELMCCVCAFCDDVSFDGCLCSEENDVENLAIA